MIVFAITLFFAQTDPPVALELNACRVVQAEDVVRVQGSRVVLSTGDIFPESEVRHSGDERYWGCWNGEVMESLYAPDSEEDDMGDSPMEGK